MNNKIYKVFILNLDNSAIFITLKPMMVDPQRIFIIILLFSNYLV